VQAIAEEVQLPPVDVVFDGTQYWLYDGFHRVEAHMRTGRFTVQAVIHQGTQVDAQWMSYGVNRSHGLKRTNDDKRRQVLAAMKHPNAATMSDREIAKHVGVDHKTIGAYRAELAVSGEIPQIAERTVNRGGQTYTQNTANIGTNQPTRPAPKRDDAAEDAWTAKQEAPAPLAPSEDMLYALRRFWGNNRDELKRITRTTESVSYIRSWLRQREPDMWFDDIRCEFSEGRVAVWLAKYGPMSGRPSDLACTFEEWALATDKIKYELLATAGRPMREVLKTDDELAAEAEAADIASREAAADEAARQARDQDFQDRMSREAAARRDAEYARQAQAAVLTPDIDTQADANRQTTRHTMLLKYLDQCIQALPEIGELTGNRLGCASLAVSLATVHKSLLAATAPRYDTPAQPPAAAPATELPADLVAHGWELVQTRPGGKMYAQVAVDGEEQPIKTQGRSKLEDVIADAQYLDKQLKIGVPA
jgi:hypothetical protein